MDLNRQFPSRGTDTSTKFILGYLRRGYDLRFAVFLLLVERVVVVVMMSFVLINRRYRYFAAAYKKHRMSPNVVHEYDDVVFLGRVTFASVLFFELATFGGGVGRTLSICVAQSPQL